MGLNMGKFLIIAGAILMLAGIIVQLAGRIPFFGKLPGDIAVERENYKFYFPITTSILISIVLSLLLFLFNKYKN
jgi:hypothetical protein